MGHRAHHLTRRTARQLSVGVERNNVLDALQNCGLTDDTREELGSAPAQQTIHVCQLSPLSFKSHPQPFARIPLTRTVHQEEVPLLMAAIFIVEAIDLSLGMPEQPIVFGSFFRLCIL